MNINNHNAIKKIEAVTKTKHFNYGFVTGFLICLILSLTLRYFQL